VTGWYIRGSGANQAAAVISGAAAVVLRQHPPSDQQSGQGPADLNHDKVGSQTDTAQGKDTLTLIHETRQAGGLT
jgi:hypothetical protein